MYNTSNDFNERLTYASDIGHELADQLRFDEVLDSFLNKLNSVIIFDNAYIVDVKSGKHFAPLIGIESGEIQMPAKEISFLKN